MDWTYLFPEWHVSITIKVLKNNTIITRGIKTVCKMTCFTCILFGEIVREHCVENVGLLGQHELVALELAIADDQRRVRVLHVVEKRLTALRAEQTIVKFLVLFKPGF